MLSAARLLGCSLPVAAYCCHPIESLYKLATPKPYNGFGLIRLAAGAEKFLLSSSFSLATKIARLEAY